MQNVYAILFYSNHGGARHRARAPHTVIGPQRHFLRCCCCCFRCSRRRRCCCRRRCRCCCCSGALIIFSSLEINVTGDPGAWLQGGSRRTCTSTIASVTRVATAGAGSGERNQNTRAHAHDAYTVNVSSKAFSASGRRQLYKLRTPVQVCTATEVYPCDART